MQKQFSGGKIGFSTNGAGAIGHTQAKNEPHLKPHALYKNEFKWTMDLNVKYKTINLQDLGLGKDFLNLTPKAPSIKRKTEKLDHIKIKNFRFGQDY